MLRIDSDPKGRSQGSSPAQRRGLTTKRWPRTKNHSLAMKKNLQYRRPKATVDEETLKSNDHTSQAQKEHLKDNSEEPQDFYSAQSHQVLGEESDQFQVPIWIDPSLDGVWKHWLEHGIKEINTAAPGLHLFTKSVEETAAKILISISTGEKSKRAYTSGNIFLRENASIYLSSNWDGKERTATHEILHALGFRHEHQREDAGKAIHSMTTEPKRIPHKGYLGLTRFDPYSIMLYPEGDHTFRRNADQDAVWKSKPDINRSNEMSELDKVGLNLMYRPCKGQHYNPKSSGSGMLYCGRSVMERHNHPDDKITDGMCGPDANANCPACRTIKTSKVDEILGRKKWQGWSGVVYCGRPVHNGLCGPNYGTPCPDCTESFID